MRAIVLTSDAPNQAALAAKLAADVEIVGIVLSENVPRRPHPRRARILLNRVVGRAVGGPFVRSWRRLLARYAASHPRLPAAPVVRVRNVNDAATVEAIERLRPDLVVVSGTNLVGRKVVEASARGLGIVNLHTGISPYVKGGPNCTNWCLERGWFHLIGNTVMWLDLGIDSGSLIATERTPLSGRESLDELHFRVMEHGHDLYVRAVRSIAAGHPVARVPQDSIAVGHTFMTAEWSPRAMARARLNFRLRFRPAAVAGPGAPGVVLVDLP